MTNVLVLANETIGGAALLDRIRARAAEGDTAFHVVVPTQRPRHGNVIYDDVVHDSAQVRIDLALEFMRDEGIEGTGEVGDPDPFNAAMDAAALRHYDDIIVSTLPATSSNWLKRDLLGRLHNATGAPVEHVIVDIDRDGLPFGVTLVVANRTVAEQELVRRLTALADEGARRFIVVVPQNSVDGSAVKEARGRLQKLLVSLDESHIVAAGMIGDPDPYTATMNAVQYFHLSEIVISTLPQDRSKWVADKLVERVQSHTNLPVEHIESKASVEGLAA